MLLPLSDIALLLDIPLSEDMQEEFYTEGTPAETAYRRGDAKFRANASKVMMTALFSVVTPAQPAANKDGEETPKRPPAKSLRIDDASYTNLIEMRAANEKKYKEEKRLYTVRKA